jgi:hypothetical protein
MPLLSFGLAIASGLLYGMIVRSFARSHSPRPAHLLAARAIACCALLFLVHQMPFNQIIAIVLLFFSAFWVYIIYG